MRVTPIAVAGAALVEVDPSTDERGAFARTFCADAFAASGLADRFPQASTSWTRAAGTLRGLHYQACSKPEAKLVRATRGSAYDVVVDLRPGSPTYRGWAAVELDARRRNAVYVPPGCAHGFLTLTDDCELLYMMSAPYDANLARTARWNDPAFAIRWPTEPSLMSRRDAQAPDHQS